MSISDELSDYAKSRTYPPTRMRLLAFAARVVELERDCVGRMTQREVLEAIGRLGQRLHSAPGGTTNMPYRSGITGEIEGLAKAMGISCDWVDRTVHAAAHELALLMAAEREAGEEAER